MAQFIFLIYLNRSGSTYLAGLLDRYDDIGVTPEAGIPDGILYKEFKINSFSDIDQYLKVLYKDDRFNSWKIDRIALKKRLLNLNKFPIGFTDCFSAILAEYFKNSNDSIYLYKSSYLFYISQVKKRFPNAKFIFIYRDLRAVYSSQRRTPDTDRKKPMATDPFKPLIHYKLAYRIFKKYQQTNWFHAIKYEDLIQNTDMELNKIINFLNISSLKKSVNSNYFSEKLSQRQKTIHQNIQSEPIIERINAWQHKLKKSEVAIIQKYAGDELNAFGYQLADINNMTLNDRIQVFWFYIKFMLSIRGKYNLLKFYLNGDIRN